MASPKFQQSSASRTWLTRIAALPGESAADRSISSILGVPADRCVCVCV